ncbi:MAG: sigma-70 family RNA polymerase sigma factor [Lachnospiraceae bacterium]|nr:sigma-70 family RNA polymerase sigma factor [Lachnospiraceae bacterium]
MINTEQYYEYLIDTYQNLVYSICFKIVRDYFEAEDLAQETFLSAYKNLESFDRQYEKAWLCRIATNKCLDYLKRTERQTFPTENEYFLTQQDRAPSPEDNILEAEVRKQLYERCSLLKTPYREVALDYFYKELSVAEIASRTGKNRKTIQTQIYRAKAMLKKKYLKRGQLYG